MENTKATVTLLFDKRKMKKECVYPVKLVVYFEGYKKRYATGIDLTKTDWEKIFKSNLRDEDLKTIRRKLILKKQKAEKVIEQLDEFDFTTFEDHFFSEKKARKSLSLKELFEEYIVELELKGRIGTASIYKTTLQSLLDFKPNLRVYDVTLKFLEEYEEYMLNKEHSVTIAKKFLYKSKELVQPTARKKGISPTTIGIYMRHLRSIINRAIASKLLPADKYPFKGYAIPSSRNVKKALTANQIKMLLNYKTENLKIQEAIDYWLFSYISNGINFSDICNLKKSDIKGEYFTFHRAKTINTRKRDKRPIKVFLTPRTKEFINKYCNRDLNNPYLFPILQQGLTPKQEKFRIQDFIQKVNDAMNSIAQELGFEGKIGTYVARHSFSTIMKRNGASTELIKETLGHASVLTTENYLDDFEDEVKFAYANKLTDL